MRTFNANTGLALALALSGLVVGGFASSASAQNLTRPNSDIRAQEAPNDVTIGQLRAQGAREGRSVYRRGESVPFFGSTSPYDDR